VLSWIQDRLIARTGAAQRVIDRFASSIGNVRVLCTENHQEFTANFFGARLRSGIRVLTELAIMDACPVAADRCADIWLKCGTEGEAAADAETDRTDFPSRGWLENQSKPARQSASKCATGVFAGALLAAGPAGANRLATQPRG
jgi:hypothetical protein